VRSKYVIAKIGLELCTPTGAHACLSRLVINQIHAFAHGVQVVISKIELVEREARLLSKTTRVGFFECVSVVVHEAIEPDHVVSEIDQSLTNVGSEETGATLNQNTHVADCTDPRQCETNST
jgi:hypothetical protein